MSMSVISRRRLLALPIVLLIRPLAAVAGQPQVFKGTYVADVGILYDLLTLHLRGGIEEIVDSGIGEYRVTAMGEGPSIQNRFESSGVLRDGRWRPVRSRSWFDIRGRQSRTEVFDVVSLPDGIHVDDVMTATLNYADGRWPAQADGVHRTLVVRRRRAENEGPDDVASSYRAEIVPLELKAVQDVSGKRAALFDLSGFSSWAKPSEPARIVFTATRRPEIITSSMILGTSVTIRFAAS
jgi:hypothetical protein